MTEWFTNLTNLLIQHRLFTFLQGRKPAVEAVVVVQWNKNECGSPLSDRPALWSMPTRNRGKCEGMAAVDADCHIVLHRRHAPPAANVPARNNSILASVFNLPRGLTSPPLDENIMPAAPQSFELKLATPHCFFLTNQALLSKYWTPRSTQPSIPTG